MRKPSKGRKERDVIYHRNDHSDDRGKHFFKILIGEFHERLVSNFLACGILECGHYLLKSEETFVTNVRRMKMVTHVFHRVQRANVYELNLQRELLILEKIQYKKETVYGMASRIHGFRPKPL
jgi:hypothetical protein